MCGNPRPFMPRIDRTEPEKSVTISILETLIRDQGVYVETTSLIETACQIIEDLAFRGKVIVCLATSSSCLGLWDLLRKRNKGLTVGYSVENVINTSNQDSVSIITSNYLDSQKGDYLLLDERVIYENTLLPSGLKYIILTKSQITPLPYPSINLIERAYPISRYYIPGSQIDMIMSILEREKGFKGAIFCTQPDMFLLKNIFPGKTICDTDETIDPDTDFIIDLFPSSKGESLNRVNSLGSRKEARCYTLYSIEEYQALPTFSLRKNPPSFEKPLSTYILKEDLQNYYDLRVSLAIDCMVFAFQSNPFLIEKSEKFFGRTMIHTYTNLFLYLINDLTRMAKQDKEMKARAFTLNTSSLVDKTIVTDQEMAFVLDQKTGLLKPGSITAESKRPFTSSVEWYVHSWCEQNNIKEDEILSFLRIFNKEEIRLLQQYEWYQQIQGWNPLTDFENYDIISDNLLDVAKKVYTSEYRLQEKDYLSYNSTVLSKGLLTTSSSSPPFTCLGIESKELQLFPSSTLCKFMIPKSQEDMYILLSPEIVKESVIENMSITTYPINISSYPLTMYPPTHSIVPTQDLSEYIRKSPIPLYMEKGLGYTIPPSTNFKIFTKQERGRIVCYIRFLNSYRSVPDLKVLVLGIPFSVASYLAKLYPSISFHLYSKEENLSPENLTFHNLPYQTGYHLLLSGIRTGSSELFTDQNLHDMQYQYEVLEIVNPVIASLLRLVPPRDRDFESYEGKILIVPWTERDSRETFLEVPSGAKKVSYKGAYYDNYLSFISRVRKEGSYPNNLIGGECSDDCYSCTSEKLAFFDLTGVKDVSSKMNELSRVTFDDLCLERHN